ncbi:hypothetical protein [Amycolatopsis sp. cmx-11-51]|uniref:hypothetical protein n=1 Tax=Amycolatopsis sp. cmx-11-51 TaxID=2785797 RepID=UPI0039E6EABC
MDDAYRLIKLISFVGWSEPEENKCGLWYEDRSSTRLTEDEQTAGHMMVSFYSGAVRVHQGSTDTSDVLDEHTLPALTLKFVTHLTTDAVTELGAMVASSLSLKGDPAMLGRHWVKDVTATCWRLALTRDDDRFGLHD